MTAGIESIAELGTILGVWAHPDDEAFLSAGLMAMARASGQRVVVLTATRGELGTPDPATWPPERLGIRRQHELGRSLAVLGVTEHAFLGHPDGGCADVDPVVGAAQVAGAIDAVRPDTILTFGPDGYTGHSDHRTVSRWVADAAAWTGAGARVLHATATPGFLERFEDVHSRFDVFFAGRPSVTRREDLAIGLDLDRRFLDLKMAALASQSSQTAGLMAEMGPARFRRWVSTETFANGSLAQERVEFAPIGGREAGADPAMAAATA